MTGSPGGREGTFLKKRFLPNEASAAALKVPTGDTRQHTSPRTPILSSKDFILGVWCRIRSPVHVSWNPAHSGWHQPTQT